MISGETQNQVIKILLENPPQDTTVFVDFLIQAPDIESVAQNLILESSAPDEQPKTAILKFVLATKLIRKTLQNKKYPATLDFFEQLLTFKYTLPNITNYQLLSDVYTMYMIFLNDSGIGLDSISEFFEKHDENFTPMAISVATDVFPAFKINAINILINIIKENEKRTVAAAVGLSHSLGGIKSSELVREDYSKFEFWKEILDSYLFNKSQVYVDAGLSLLASLELFLPGEIACQLNKVYCSRCLSRLRKDMSNETAELTGRVIANLPAIDIAGFTTRNHISSYFLPLVSFMAPPRDGETPEDSVAGKRLCDFALARLKSRDNVAMFYEAVTAFGEQYMQLVFVGIHCKAVEHMLEYFKWIFPEIDERTPGLERLPADTQADHVKRMRERGVTICRAIRYGIAFMDCEREKDRELTDQMCYCLASFATIPNIGVDRGFVGEAVKTVKSFTKFGSSARKALIKFGHSILSDEVLKALCEVSVNSNLDAETVFTDNLLKTFAEVVRVITFKNSSATDTSDERIAPYVKAMSSLFGMDASNRASAAALISNIVPSDEHDRLKELTMKLDESRPDAGYQVVLAGMSLNEAQSKQITEEVFKEVPQGDGNNRQIIVVRYNLVVQFFKSRAEENILNATKELKEQSKKRVNKLFQMPIKTRMLKEAILGSVSEIVNIGVEIPEEAAMNIEGVLETVIQSEKDATELNKANLDSILHCTVITPSPFLLSSINIESMTPLFYQIIERTPESAAAVRQSVPVFLSYLNNYNGYSKDLENVIDKYANAVVQHCNEAPVEEMIISGLKSLLSVKDNHRLTDKRRIAFYMIKVLRTLKKFALTDYDAVLALTEEILRGERAAIETAAVITETHETGERPPFMLQKTAGDFARQLSASPKLRGAALSAMAAPGAENTLASAVIFRAILSNPSVLDEEGPNGTKMIDLVFKVEVPHYSTVADVFMNIISDLLFNHSEEAIGPFLRARSNFLLETVVRRTILRVKNGRHFFVHQLLDETSRIDAKESSLPFETVSFRAMSALICATDPAVSLRESFFGHQMMLIILWIEILYQIGFGDQNPVTRSQIKEASTEVERCIEAATHRAGVRVDTTTFDQALRTSAEVTRTVLRVENYNIINKFVEAADVVCGNDGSLFAVGCSMIVIAAELRKWKEESDISKNIFQCARSNASKVIAKSKGAVRTKLISMLATENALEPEEAVKFIPSIVRCIVEADERGAPSSVFRLFFRGVEIIPNDEIRDILESKSSAPKENEEEEAIDGKSIGRCIGIFFSTQASGDPQLGKMALGAMKKVLENGGSIEELGMVPAGKLLELAATSEGLRQEATAALVLCGGETREGIVSFVGRDSQQLAGCASSMLSKMCAVIAEEKSPKNDGRTGGLVVDRESLEWMALVSEEIHRQQCGSPEFLAELRSFAIDLGIIQTHNKDLCTRLLLASC